MVVVDDEPRARGPLGEVLAEDLCECLDVLGRGWKRAEVLAEPYRRVVDDRRRSSAQARARVPRRPSRTSAPCTRRRTRPSRATHCSARSSSRSRPARRASGRCAFDSSRSANNRGRSTILRLRIREFGDCRRRRTLLTDVTWIDPRPYHRRSSRALAAAPAAASALGQRGSRAASRWRRPADSGSSPVRSRNAIGIWRRRCTPSFSRSTSQCAFTVLGEIPSRSADLVVRATRCDQCDDLPLPRRDRGRLSLRCQLDHGARSYSLVRGTAIRPGV